MHTLLGWLLLILIDIKSNSSASSLSNWDIASGILFLLGEFVIFFDLPGAKILKNSNQLALKKIGLSEIASTNEEKIKKIRIIIFMLTMIIVLSISKIAQCNGIICRSYIIFLFCTNLDIALALATAEARKQYLKKFGVENFKGILVGIAVLAAILATWFYFFK